MARAGIRITPFRTRLAGLVEWPFGCSHRRTTLAVTARGDDSTGDSEAASREAYVDCLKCGRQLAHDWTSMRLDSHRGQGPRTPKGRA